MDENIIFSKTNMRLISNTNINKDTIEILSYAFLGYKSNKNEDNKFAIEKIISGWISRKDYVILKVKYPALFEKSVEEAFCLSEEISVGTLLDDVLDLHNAEYSLKMLRERQRKPDYFDCLSEIKKKNKTKNWFYNSH